MAVTHALTRPEDKSAELIERMVDLCAVRDTTVNSCRIRWRVLGSGQPLMLLHGGHGSWMHWIRNIESLASDFMVLVPDMPDFNESSDLGSYEGRDLDTLARALRDGLHALIGTQSVHLVGFSFGGLVAARMAVDMPDLKSLVLLGPAGHGFARRQSEALVDWRKQQSTEARQAALRQNLASFMLYHSASLNALALEVHEQSCLLTRFRSKAISRAGALPGLLEALSVQMLMVWGEHDVTAQPEEVAEALKQDRAERDWCLVSTAGHWVQFERADEVNRLLRCWLKASAE